MLSENRMNNMIGKILCMFGFHKPEVRKFTVTFSGKQSPCRAMACSRCESIIDWQPSVFLCEDHGGYGFKSDCIECKDSQPTNFHMWPSESETIDLRDQKELHKK